MKIVVCSSHDWANLGYTVAKSFRSIGLDSQSYALFEHAFKYKETSKRVYVEELKDKIKEADTVIMMHSGSGILWDFVYDKISINKEILNTLSDKQLIIHHGGSVYTQYHELINNLIHPRCDVAWVQNSSFANKTGTYNEVLYYPPIDVDSLSFDDNYYDHKILHAPSNPDKKGTDIIKTNDSITVDLKILQYEENIKRIKECDIYVDQIGSGAFGMTTLEAAAMGKIVISSFEGEYPHGECKIQMVNDKEELNGIVDSLHEMTKEELYQLKRDTYNWVRETHSLQEFAKGMLPYLYKKYDTPVYILNLEERIERKEYITDLLKREGLDYTFFKAISWKDEKFDNILKLQDMDILRGWRMSKKDIEKIDTPIPKYAIDTILRSNVKKGEAAVSLSTLLMLKEIYNKGYKTVLCLQDDSQWKLGDLRKELVRFNNYDKKVDICYLGCNILGEGCKNIDDNYKIPEFNYNAHAIIYTRKGIEKILNSNLDKNLMSYDEYLNFMRGKHYRKDINVFDGKLDAIATHEEVVSQRNYSGIEGNTGLWENDVGSSDIIKSPEINDSR